MKKVIYFVILITLVLCSTKIKTVAKSEVTNEPYETQIVGLDGQLVNSSMAYEGIDVINPGFSDPKDLYIDNADNVYIADKGHKVIFKYNPKTRQTIEIGKGILQGPTGVFVDEKENIYVADYESKCVFVFNSKNALIRTIERPTEPLFGEESQFRPTKVSVDKRGNVYITSEGNANGVIQINTLNEFTGYFGANNVNVTLSLLMKRMFLSKEDKETYASLKPKATTNLIIDEKNIVYTVTEGATSSSLKKYNVNGTNMLNSDITFSQTYKDITVDKNGLIYTVSKDNPGVISVLDNYGNLLFLFGNTKSGSMSMGQFDEAAGIDVDSNGNIWVLDGAGKNVQVFTKTAFASTVIDAMILYNNGEYEQAKMVYEEIVKQNSSFVEAYIGLGKIAQRQQDFSTAKDYFKIANYKSGYSEVFWELRDDWLNRNLLWMVGVLIILIALKAFKVKKLIYKRIGYDSTATIKKIKGNRYVQEFSYLPMTLKKPNYVFYDIKFLQKIRLSTALLMFALFIVINIACDTVITGYLFNNTQASSINLAFELLKWGLIIVLFTVANFLVSSLQNGEGFFRDIFIGTLIAFAPILLFKLPVSILSNVLTNNEAYIYNLLNMILWAWSIFNVLLMIKTIHNYKVKELVLNIILTAIAVIILVFLYLMIYILFMQFWQFFVGLIKEGIMR